MKADFHLHTDFSGDSDTPMADMIQHAIYLGLDTICFTEHFDQDFPPEFGDFSLDICSYYERVNTLRSAYGSHLKILFGVELGMQSHLADYYQTYVSHFPFDFVIASQHLADGLDPYYPDYWQTRSSREGIEEYFTELLANLKKMKSYDTLGHLDYIVRYAPDKDHGYCYESYASYIDPILLHLIERDKCLEVNSAGLKYGLGHPNPQESVLKRYRELGGEKITVGSDGHCPGHIAYDFKTLQQLLSSLGFRYYFTFEQRQPVCRRLEE